MGVDYHGVRFRMTGHRLLVEVHLLFAHDTPVGRAHELATVVEEKMSECLEVPAEVITHLESMEDHAAVHKAVHYTGRPS
jgi:divalent metal cation (Fe/Co/Zn/Cd) transporter